MFFSKPRCPLNDDERLWVEHNLHWLHHEFGDVILQKPVVLPTDEFFPDAYEPTLNGAAALLQRVCSYMCLDPAIISLEIHRGGRKEFQELMDILPSYQGKGHATAAGIYKGTSNTGKEIVSLEEEQLEDPAALIATLAHELGHVILLGGERVNPDDEDHEPLTDLLTVFFGLGIFSANSAFQFNQWESGHKIGWQTNNLGYLTEQAFGYALGCFAYMRHEYKPEWLQYLDANLRSDVKATIKYLKSVGSEILQVQN